MDTISANDNLNQKSNPEKGIEPSSWLKTCDKIIFTPLSYTPYVTSFISSPLYLLQILHTLLLSWNNSQIIKKCLSPKSQTNTVPKKREKNLQIQSSVSSCPPHNRTIRNNERQRVTDVRRRPDVHVQFGCICLSNESIDCWSQSQPGWKWQWRARAASRNCTFVLSALLWSFLFQLR